MSSILDALRRLEREQNEPSQADFSFAPEEPPSRRPRLWRGAAVAVVASGIAIITVLELRRGAVLDDSQSQVAANRGRENVATARRAGSRRERQAKGAGATHPALRRRNEESVPTASKPSKEAAVVAKSIRAKDTPPALAEIARGSMEHDRLRRTRADFRENGERRELASRLHDTRDRVHRDLARLRPLQAPRSRTAPDADRPPADARPAPAGITEGRIPMRDRLHATRRQAKSQAGKNVIEIPRIPPPAATTERGSQTEAASLGATKKTDEHAAPNAQGQEEVMRRPPRGAPRVRVSFLFYSTDPSRRRVMLTIDGGKPTTLFEGQSVESLTIARILPDAVHLRYEGKLFAVRPR